MDNTIKPYFFRFIGGKFEIFYNAKKRKWGIDRECWPYCNKTDCALAAISQIKVPAFIKLEREGDQETMLPLSSIVLGKIEIPVMQDKQVADRFQPLDFGFGSKTLVRKIIFE